MGDQPVYHVFGLCWHI